MDQLELAVYDGSVLTESELRSRFRHLALERHPDLGGVGASNEAFWNLVADFQRAIGRLRNQEEEPRQTGWSACACTDALGDLIASGFPISDQIQPTPRGYLLARSSFLNEYSKRKDGGELFLHFEQELNEIRSRGVVWNPLLGVVKLILMNLPGLGSANTFGHRAIERWLATLRGEKEPEWRVDADAARSLEGLPHIVPFLESISDIARECGAMPR